MLVEAGVKQCSTKAFALWDDDAAIEVRSLSWYDEKLGENAMQITFTINRDQVLVHGLAPESQFMFVFSCFFN